jgi:hypothetical protein
MSVLRLHLDEDACTSDDEGPGMLASPGFWWGGAVSAGLWTLLLLAVT